MSIFPTKAHRLIPICFALLLTFSCSKDSDLLADYVSTDGIDAGVARFIVDDAFLVSVNASVRLDVLSNDSFPDKKKVRITGTSNPRSGNVNINEDNTITYTPEEEEPTTDTFTYTAEVTNEDGSSTSGTGNVTVSTTDQQTTTLHEDVTYWKEQFDAKWAIDYPKALELSQSANLNQEYYYLGYYIDGLTSIWQATGDNEYLNTALNLINNTTGDVRTLESGYLGWLSLSGDQIALWDSFYWRHVATLLRIMHNSPSLLANPQYKSQYDKLLEFSEKNIWERYEVDGLGNFYRSRTHMASHWARIGMELYLITGKAKYHEVFSNISHGTMIGYPSNLRKQIFSNPQDSSAYLWDLAWGVTYGSELQDTSHAGAIISFIVLAHENNMYWSKEDVESLIATLEIVWPDNNYGDAKKYIDGSGGNEISGRIHEWLYLGRFDANVQAKIKSLYKSKNLDFYGTQPLGIAALNAKILADGKGYYPEN